MLNGNLILNTMITYGLIPKRNPSNPEAPPSYHACASSTGSVDLRGLAELLSERCTLTAMDILAVLEGLTHVIPQQMANGNIIRLAEFGSFRLSLRSEGVENPADFTQSQISETKVLFRPGSEFTRRLQNIQYVKRAG